MNYLCFSKLVLLLLGVCFVNRVVAQTNVITCDTSIYLSRETFASVVTRQFSSIVTGQAQSNIGNYAAVDIKEALVSFNGSAIICEHAIISVNANGAISSGVSSIFSDSKVSANYGFEAKLHLLSPSNNKLTFLCGSVINVKKAIKKLNSLSAARENFLLSDSIFLQSQLKTITAELRTLGARTGINSPEYIKKQFVADSLQLVLENKYLNNSDDIKSAVKKETGNQLKKLQDSVDITGFRIGWFSLGYKFQNKNFYTFNASLPFDQQVAQQDFNASLLSVNYNLYKWSNQPFESYYLLGTVSGSFDDNKDLLDETDVSESATYAQSPNQRVSSKKFKAYTGDYQAGLKGLKISVDYYRFLFEKNIAALHVYPNVLYREKFYPTYNLGIGFVYSFKDKNAKDGKSIVNAELYTHLMDLTSNESTKTLFNRSEIGLRFAFPIIFFSK